MLPWIGTLAISAELEEEPSTEYSLQQLGSSNKEDPRIWLGVSQRSKRMNNS